MQSISPTRISNTNQYPSPSLDALVNNAAVSGEYEDNGSHAPNNASLSSNLMAAFKTNTIGPAITVAAFADLLGKSTKTPRIINVTSGAGSIGMRLDFSHPHQQMQLVTCPSRNSQR
jgi:NAD(P)-dependent dehydrogenase (short-subunit alcohol dehydrogenase family)